ncbi:hypothetical protein [Mycolicibacterium palauense]|uniref:hypothetical protein n=1 Tax=Mycolicibacterium palauense TaxID=2034511 RepID=UPI000BFF02D0|nr:hypothetical protein [Mycolicibacterium palauense]
MSGFQTYTHNPTEVDALQVAKPWNKIKVHVPFAHPVYQANGRTIEYFKISTPGELTVKKAHPGDWIVKYPTGCVSVLTDEQFQRYYGEGE